MLSDHWDGITQAVLSEWQATLKYRLPSSGKGADEFRYPTTSPPGLGLDGCRLVALIAAEAARTLAGADCLFSSRIGHNLLDSIDRDALLSLYDLGEVRLLAGSAGSGKELFDFAGGSGTEGTPLHQEI